MNITQAIKDYLLVNSNLDLVGIAPSASIDYDGVKWKSDDILPGAKSIIVFAKKMCDGAIQAGFRMHEDANGYAASIYSTYSVELTPNFNLFFASFNTAKYIEKEFGAVAAAIPCNQLQNMTAVNKPLPAFAGPTRRYEILELNRAVVASGLGEISWCGWPITPQYGPRQMFGMILTTLELDYDEPYSGSKLCNPKKCGICVSVCPTNAIPPANSEPLQFEVRGVTYSIANVNKNACAVASLAFRNEFSGRYNFPNQILNNSPSDEEVENAFAEKPISHCSIEHYPKHFCNKCLLYCPLGDWETRFANKHLTSFRKEECK